MTEEQRIRIEEGQIDLIELFHVMLRKLWLIVICGVIGLVAVGGYTKLFVTPQYSASSMIYIFGSTSSLSDLANSALGTQLTSDFQTLAQSRAVLEKVIEELDLDMSYGELSGSISVTNPASTRFLKLTVTNEDPELAKDISNTMAEVTSDRVAEVMNTDRPTLMEKAVTPAAPSSPNLMKNALMGGLVGAAVAIGLILLQFMMNDTIQSEADVKRYLGVNVLAMLPEEKRRKVAR